MAFAGVHDPNRAGVAGLHGRVARALDGLGPVQTAATGALVVGWTGDGVPGTDPFTVVDGPVFDGVGGVTPDALPTATSTNAAVSSAYRARGEPVFAGLRGQFAALVYDEHADAGVLARDQFGEQGLHWHIGGSRLVFASEVRYLLALLDRRPDPDPVSIVQWIGMWGTMPTRTMFDGVQRVDAGHLLRFGGGRAVQTARYWTPRYERPARRPRDEHVAALAGALGTAVRRRVRPGEPMAVLLSGGLDSSTVAAIASTFEPDRRPRRAYSATFPAHPSIDESALIDLTSDRLGLDSTRVVVRSGSVVDGAAEYIGHWHVPPPSPNLFFWFPLLRRMAADRMLGFVDGEGGDEIFGLSPYLMADRLRHGRVLSAFDLARRIPGGGAHLRFRHLWPFVKEFGVKGAAPPGVHALIRRQRAADHYLPPYVSAASRRLYVEHDAAPDWKRLSGPRWWSSLVNVVFHNSGVPIAADHLRLRASLAGVEARHPLRDVDLIEQVLRTPPELAFDTRWSRPLQREITDGLLPDEVRRRHTKSTFDALFHDALAGPDLTTARAVLRPGAAEVGAFVDLAIVDEHLLRAPPPPGERLEWAMRLWRLLTAECWLRAQAGDLRSPDVWPRGVVPDLYIA